MSQSTSTTPPEHDSGWTGWSTLAIAIGVAVVWTLAAHGRDLAA